MDDASKFKSFRPAGVGDASGSATAFGTGTAPRLGAVTTRDPEATGAWLHVVSAASVPVLSRAVFELAARFLAAGHRVLLMDGTPKLRLHERFDRECRWGMVECLRGELPVLGLVQDTGRLGLYLMAHGTPEGTPSWEGLPGILDQARPHVGRAILALDPGAPGTVGRALAGLHLEGWWPQGGNQARRAAGTGGRLGIPFSDLNLDELLIPRLEALDARVWNLVAPVPEPGAEAAAAADSPRPEPAESTVVPEPVSLESDPRVRERLRFLLWMRRVEAEEGASVATGAPVPDVSEPS